MKTNQHKHVALICALGLGFALVGCAGMPAADVAGSASMNTAKQSAEDGTATKASR